MKKFAITTLSLLLWQCMLPAVAPDEAFQKLVEGNKRFVTGQLEHPENLEAIRESTVNKQNPFAMILGCADSRVSPELLFDQNIGDLFVVRDAAQVLGPIERESLEFCALTFNASLIVVLGHENCGAVRAAIEGSPDSKEFESIMTLLAPAVKQSADMSGNRLVNATKANVMLVVAELKKNPVIARLIEEKKLKVVGGYYELQSGKVEFLQ